MNAVHSFSFLAQSLDNRAPDSISVYGRLLSDNDVRSPERVGFVDRTTYISSRGKEVRANESTCRAFVLDDDVLLETTGPKRDTSGRLAPILCLGNRHRPPRTVWADALKAELEEFGDASGREISPRQLSDIDRLAERLLPSERSGLKAMLPFRPRGAEDAPIELPAEPRDRRVILVLSEANLRFFKSRRDLKATLNESRVAIALLTEGGRLAAHSELGTALSAHGLLEPRAMLVQNPYDPNQYFRVENRDQELARAKLHTYVRLCQLLGAKRVVCESLRQIWGDNWNRTEIQASAHSPGFAVNGAYSRVAEGAAWLEQFLSYEQEFSAAEGDIVAAEDFVRGSGLEWDQDLRHLLDTYRYRRNSVSSMRMTLSTKDGLHQVITTLRGIEAAVAKCDLRGDTREASSASVEFQVRVSFGSL